jgi:hypothetical protein
MTREEREEHFQSKSSRFPKDLEIKAQCGSAYNPRTWEAESGGWKVWDQPELYRL